MARGRDSDIPRGLHRYPDGKWGVEYYTPEGKRRRRKIGLKSEALRYYAEITRRKQVGDVLPDRRPTIRPTLAHYLAEYGATATNHVGRTYAAKWSQMLGHLAPEQLTAQMLRNWIQRAEIQEGLAPATIRRWLSVLSPVYSRLVREGIIGPHQNPLRDKRALGLRPLNNERIRQLTLEQELALVNAYGERWWPYVEFSLLTLMRFENQASLRWEDIHPEVGVAMIPRAKHGRKQPVQLSGRALEILEEQRRRYPGSEYCFPSVRGKKLHRHNFRKRVWLPANEAAGLVDFHWHDWRHAAAGRLAMAGHSLYEIQQALGQRTPRMVQRYAHLTDAHMKGVMERLASLSVSERRLNGEIESPLPVESEPEKQLWGR